MYHDYMLKVQFYTKFATPFFDIYVNSIQFKASASSSFEKIVFTSQFFVNFVNNPAVTKRSRHYIQNCMTYQHKLNKVVINHQIF